MEVNIDNKEVLISVVIPLYNARKYILETVESVLNQTYENLEIIIVDDCSTDDSIEIVKKIQKQDKRVKLVESETNFGGPARPRNIGIENSNGEYIAFLDADDVWLPEKLEKQLNFLLINRCDIVHTKAYMIDIESEMIGKFKNQKIYNKLKYFFNDLTILYFSNFININTVLMKKDISLKFKEDKNLIALEDWMFWIENLYNGKKILLLDDFLINYRFDINSISDRKSDKSYRKAYYMYALLLLEKKISMMNFLTSFSLNTFRILLKNMK
ncbi:MAG: glycosyltransferase family 2 protein [Campylobacterota bacterium]|nr:glycosyltransferase family 2 protein [Campylobacterota bacterium]